MVALQSVFDAVVQGDGHIVHLKGQVSLDVRGHVFGRGDFRAQVRKTLENIRDVLGQWVDACRTFFRWSLLS